MMKGHVANLEDLTPANKDFRHGLETGQNLQLVLMSLNVGQNICCEPYAAQDQFIHIDPFEQKTSPVVQASSEHFDGKVTG